MWKTGAHVLANHPSDSLDPTSLAKVPNCKQSFLLLPRSSNEQAITLEQGVPTSFRPQCDTILVAVPNGFKH